MLAPRAATYHVRLDEWPENEKMHNAAGSNSERRYIPLEAFVNFSVMS